VAYSGDIYIPLMHIRSKLNGSNRVRKYILIISN